MLQSDYRLGGKVRYFALVEEGSLMLVPDEIRKCVVFLGYQGRYELKLGGTAFFLGVEIKDLNIRFPYLITARHNIDKVRDNSVDQMVQLRVNLRGGGARTIAIPIQQWVFHPEDPSVDVAVLRWLPPKEQVDFLAIPACMYASNETIVEQGIGVGDEVFITGQFTRHRGEQRNLPIIRTGNIAMMPEEPVWTEMGFMDAYLIEARSIGGLSGSPVFVHLGGIRVRDGVAQLGGTKRLFYWLGLIHGHWDLDVVKNHILAQDDFAKEKVNVGIAIVVPASKVMEVVNQPELAEERERIVEEERRGRLPTPDSAQEGLTKEAFEDPLKRVSRPKESPPAEEKSET